MGGVSPPQKLYRIYTITSRALQVTRVYAILEAVSLDSSVVRAISAYLIAALTGAWVRVPPSDSDPVVITGYVVAYSPGEDNMTRRTIPARGDSRTLNGSRAGSPTTGRLSNGIALRCQHPRAVVVLFWCAGKGSESVISPDIGAFCCARTERGVYYARERDVQCIPGLPVPVINGLFRAGAPLLVRLFSAWYN